jgi:hypothetical protein
VAGSLPLSVFCSYSHKDKSLRDEVEDSLAPIKTAGLIKDIWTDRRITAGERWADVIDEQINDAGLILLLVSRAFLASSYCMGKEVERALERADAGEARVISIILRECDWRKASFAKLQVLPDEGKPIHPWYQRDKRLLQVTEGIRKTVESIRAAPGLQPARPDGPRRTKLPEEIPYALPYLCDRGPQEDPLETAMETHRKEKPLRPFVCFAHGSEDEDLSGFRLRLMEHSLPRILGLGPDRKLNVHYPLEWPGGYSDFNAALRSIPASLGSVLNCARDQVPAALLAQGSPVMISTEVLSGDWRASGENPAAAFLKFWNDWRPDLPSVASLIILVLINYERVQENGSSSRPKHPQADRDIRAFLGKLRPSDYPNLSLEVLPELAPIPRVAVESWRQYPQMLRYCPKAPQHEDWAREIRSLFAVRERIPMQLLVPTLRSLLAKC